MTNLLVKKKKRERENKIVLLVCYAKNLLSNSTPFCLL